MSDDPWMTLLRDSSPILLLIAVFVVFLIYLNRRYYPTVKEQEKIRTILELQTARLDKLENELKRRAGKTENVDE